MDARSVGCAVWLAVAVVALPSGCVAPVGPLAEDGWSEGDALGAASLAIATQEEAEPNDAPGDAGVRGMVMGDDNRGRFGPGDAADHWNFELSARTYVNLFLGDIPAGSDYDVALYRSPELANPVWRGQQSGNAIEIAMSLDLEAGLYHVKVYPYASPRDDVTYRLRYASSAVSRGWKWVEARVPYCGGPNGGRDILCGGTCTRTGGAQDPAWDPYRSDCSGFVSWAWGLPAPGITTRDIPGVAAPVPSELLVPGDALLGPGHVVLFAAWIDRSNGRALILEEPDCGGVARDLAVTLTPSGEPTVRLFGATYTAYRYRMP
ncbi:hypothetical protein AB3662_43655 [Sorangium cellulosum]|uniref:hypothetical protein n=1 Tax=Sorangium cellulosum TaxID=56 RepID=UPI003D9A2B3C